MAAHPDSVIQELSRLHINHMTPQQYSPLRGKKIAPVVPPKPKKVVPMLAVHTTSHLPDATYANLSAPVMPCKAEPQASPASAFERHAVVPAAALDSTDPLPPPPPPPTLGRVPSYSASLQQQTCRSASYSEDLPPPSPPRSPDSLAYGTAQSSSASFHHFRPQSSASTYDTGSIYEPIVPRPPSQMSGYSSTGSSLYSSYYPGGGRMAKPAHRSGGQEAEVDHLTDLLVQSMENSGDPDFFEDDEEPPVIGMCYKCGEKVLGEGSGCTAMDQVYHIKCFTCHVCMKELRGKPFFAMEGSRTVKMTI